MREPEAGKRLVFFKMYPSDHLGDVKLRKVKRATRSFAIDIYCLMHQSGDGHLRIGGKPPTTHELARFFGDRPDATQRMMNQLLECGHFLKNAEGVIYSPKLVADLKDAAHARKVGAKGGNPALIPGRKFNRFNR